MKSPSKYAYFVVNDSDNLEELQNILIPFGGVEAMKDVIIDYALDKRRIIDLIKRCNKHDVIYTPYLARLGKSLKELYQIVGISNERGIELIFCDKLNVSFSETNLNGKINLASLQWAAELDFAIRSEYNKAHVAKRRDLIERKGDFIIENGPNAGEKCYYVGSPKQKNMSDAQKIALSATQEAAALANQNAKITWKENSSAYKWVKARVAEGMPRKEIIRLFNEQHELNPDVYCTREGKPLSKGVLSKWCREMNPLADDKNSSDNDV